LEHLLGVAARAPGEIRQHLAGQDVELLRQRVRACERAHLLVHRAPHRALRDLSVPRAGVEQDLQRLVERVLLSASCGVARSACAAAAPRDARAISVPARASLRYVTPRGNPWG